MPRRIHIECEHYYISNELDVTNTSYIYGEAYTGDIIKCMNDHIPNIDEMTSFIDIGSGVGRLVIDVGKTYSALMCYGIEIHKKRYESSICMMNTCNQDNIDFENVCFRTLYFGNYDIIYCCNTVFSKDDNNVLYRKIENEVCGGYVLLYNYNDILKPYLKTKCIINTSWQDNVELYVFYVC